MATHTRQLLFSSAGRGWASLQAELVVIPAGRSSAPAGESHVLGLHFGKPVNANCSIGGKQTRYLQKPGDIGVIPAGFSGSWEDDDTCQILRLSFRPSFLDEVAEQLGRDPAKCELVPNPQFRDARLEALGWAIKSDLEDDTPSEPLYIDSLTKALAVRLLEVATGRPPQRRVSAAQRLSTRQLKALLEFIESNLDQRISLSALAAIAGVRSTHLKVAFRNSTGVPVHQYVIRRRIECARAMLSTTTLPASQVALATGFAHQSHMSSTMRRILGHAPGEISRPQNKF